MNNILDRLAQLRLVPMVVMDNAEHAAAFGDALVAGGLPVAEITFRTPAAEESIRALAEARRPAGRRRHGSHDRAGRPGDRRRGAVHRRAGHQSESRRARVEARRADGARRRHAERDRAGHVARRDGAEIFPGRNDGRRRDAQGVRRAVSGRAFIPTGGITPELLPNYLRLPKVVACGGSWLAPREFLAAGRFDAIAALIGEAKKLLTGRRMSRRNC